MNLQSRPGPAAWSIAGALALGLITAACGYDNPGEPRKPAEELSAPNLGAVHVYCVEREHVSVTPCQVDLAAQAGNSSVELRDWWLRAARALHAAGTFHYKDGDWSFGEIFVEAKSASGEHVRYGWRCRGDERHTLGYVVKLMGEREPGATRGIGTLAAAAKHGCKFAREPRTDGA
jgi:hypothetical protein